MPEGESKGWLAASSLVLILVVLTLVAALCFGLWQVYLKFDKAVHVQTLPSTSPRVVRKGSMVPTPEPERQDAPPAPIPEVAPPLEERPPEPVYPSSSSSRGGSPASHGPAGGASRGGAAPAPILRVPPRSADDRPRHEKVQRYPNIEAPDRVPPLQKFYVQVSLTKQPVSSETEVQPGRDSAVDPDGRLTMNLPKKPDGEPWKILVVLTAPDFEIDGGKNDAMIELPAEGDSTPALFALTAKAASAVSKVSATFWVDGGYVARATRTIRIESGPVTARSTGRRLVAAPVVVTTMEPPAPDLTVRVEESGAAGHRVCQMTIESPHFAPRGSKPCTPAELVQPWLAKQYTSIVGLSRSVRGVRVAGDGGPVSKEQALAKLRGIGRDLYKLAAGTNFDQAFWEVVDRQQKDGYQFKTIQIYTNNPAVPWELMVPNGAGRARDGFLGTEFNIARWHISDEISSRDVPPRQLALREVAAIAPHYVGASALAHQDDEISVLAGMDGYQQIKAQFAGIEQLLKDPPEGVVHFAGHGVATHTPGGVDYAIQLEGGATLNLTNWKGMMRENSAHHPLYFLNACDVGQADRVLNFVDGWAPTVLDNGGSGFIGGLWPLSDKGASAFAVHFYQGLQGRLGSGGSGMVAELLKDSRKAFFDSGDPTFLGYVFYGDVNLSMYRPR